jgi:PGAP1-like protein
MIISIQHKTDHSTCRSCKLFRKDSNELRAGFGVRIVARVVGWLLFGVAIASAQLHAQLAYDHTSFLNGFASDSTIWTRSYADIQTTPPAFLGQRIILRTSGYPNVDSLKRYSGQVNDIAAYLAQGGQHVLVAHSLGSLVSRGTYIDNPGIRSDVAAIVTLTAPHQGAPLADNFVLLRNFLRDMQRRIDDAKTAIAIEAAVLTNVFSMFFPGKRTTGLGPSVVAFLVINTLNTPIDVSNLDQFGVAPAFRDLSPDSAAVSYLNTRYDDGAIPRANIYGTIPFRNAALRLYESARDMDADFPSLVRWRNIGQSSFSACKWIGYVTIVQWTLGRRCAYARKTLGRLDDRWAKYVNGWDANGNTRYVPFDGVVPNERSRYPTNGLAFDQPVDLVNHLNIYKTQAGLRKAGDGMLSVGMVPVGNPPPPSALTASIAGPASVRPNVNCAWQAGVSGGTPPYSYYWTKTGGFNGYDSEAVTSFSSSGTLYLQVGDANGQSSSTSKAVSVSSSNPICPL